MTVTLDGSRRWLQSIVINYILINLVFVALQSHVSQKVCYAVNVQRLQVPDLVVIEQTIRNVQQQQQDLHQSRLQAAHSPEAASLITANSQEQQQQQQQITFECLISYDKKRDKNLIVKWHHDERNEPIYQWILELNKLSIAPQYRAFIMPIVSANVSMTQNRNGPNTASATNQTIEASFKLVRPTKELGGKYTCSAISSQNDDSKSKKMIVYTPPRSFTFNASRANLGALFATQRERLIQLSQPTGSLASVSNSNLPLAYRMRGLEASGPTTTLASSTISPQMLSTIDYVNVNQARHSLVAPQIQAATPRRSGLKLVCDIEQVFPVPEVNIYRLARLDGSTQPDRLPKLDTRIERDFHTGLFHVQVTSVIDDDELAIIRHNQLMQMATIDQQSMHQQQQQAQPMQPLRHLPVEIYFECVIALTNLELSRYADNRRQLIYRPASAMAPQMSENMRTFEQANSGSASGPLAVEQVASKTLLLVAVVISTLTIRQTPLMLMTTNKGRL